jgi:hypothetical protein
VCWQELTNTHTKHPPRVFARADKHEQPRVLARADKHVPRREANAAKHVPRCEANLTQSLSSRVTTALSIPSQPPSLVQLGQY